MWRAFTLICLLVFSIGLAQEEVREDLQVTLVSLYVSAVDEDGNYVTDLKPEDFILLENGQIQTINTFSGGSDDVSLTIAFLMDNSGSITASDLEMARGAGLLLLREMQQDDKFFLITFRHSTKSLVEPTFDKQQIESTLQTIRPQYGTTALYDAIYQAAGKLDRELGRKVLLLFSDGQDNTSTRRLNDLLTGVAALTDITVISVGTPFHKQSAERYGALEAHKKGRTALEQLAQTTGGFSVFPENNAELNKVVLGLRNWIRNQYTIGYYPTNRKQDGSWREIRLQSRRKEVRLSYRNGYFAPDAADTIRTGHSAVSDEHGYGTTDEHR